MKCLADLLTLSRFVLAGVLFGMAFTGGQPEVAFIVFVVGEITDALDGTCASKWPYPKNKAPWYRKYAAKYDMIADVLLAIAEVFFILMQVNMIAGISILVSCAIICGIIELIVYGKFFGHPDDCKPNSLAKKNFPLAKKIVLARRYVYVGGIAAMAVMTLVATKWSVLVKILAFIAGCLMLVFVWFFLRQRRENISRDAVDIEKKLGR